MDRRRPWSAPQRWRSSWILKMWEWWPKRYEILTRPGLSSVLCKFSPFQDREGEGWEPCTSPACQDSGRCGRPDLVQAPSPSLLSYQVLLTNAVYEDQAEIHNVKDSEDYEKLVEGVSQLFSWQNVDRDEVSDDTQHCQNHLGLLRSE